MNGRLDVMGAKLERLVAMVRARWQEREKRVQKILDAKDEAYD